MKKLITSMMSIVLAFAMLFSFGCAKETLAMGKEMVKYKSQLDAMRELNKGTVNAIVIDSTMAGHYCNVGDYAGQLSIVPDLILAQEEYGIAAKKGNYALIREINDALIALSNNGTVQTIAEQFNVASYLVPLTSVDNPITEEQAQPTQDDFNSINKIVIGITIYAPIAYYKTNNNLEDQSNYTGFDIELARAVVEYLSTKHARTIGVEFTIIDWNTKEAKLENGDIHLVWNGMTITPDRQENMCISLSYLYNKQVAVVKTEDLSKYSDKASFKNAVIGVEKGSAGQAVVQGK